MSPAAAPVGLLVMSYGTPAGPDNVEAYYTHIRRGRPPSPEQLAELQQRYEAIGGVSPLAERSRAQAQALARALEAAPGGPRQWAVRVGFKHASPFVEEAVDDLVAAGSQLIVGLVLAPHWSQASVGEYHNRAAVAAGSQGAVYQGIESWSDEPAWLDLLARLVADSLARLPSPTTVLFTAHSLPERVLDDDPYPDQLLASAGAIAQRAGLGPAEGWRLAWQSAGRTPEPWRGPDVTGVIRELAAAGDTRSVLVCPQGFVSDHLEVLYDLDVDAAKVAAGVGLAFARTPSVNDDPTVMAALAARVRAAADPR